MNIEVLQIVKDDQVIQELPVPETQRSQRLKLRKLQVIAKELGEGYSVRTTLPKETE